MLVFVNVLRVERACWLISSLCMCGSVCFLLCGLTLWTVCVFVC